MQIADGSMDDLNVYATGDHSSASVDIQTEGSIGQIDVLVGDQARVFLTLDLAQGADGINGANIAINDTESAAGRHTGQVYVSFGENTSDTIDLGGYSGSTNMEFRGGDTNDPFVFDESHHLSIDGVATDSGTIGAELSMSFNGSGPDDGTFNFVDGGASNSGADFAAAATTALEGTNAEFYFGVVGGNGFLAYDFNHVGVTGVIELAGVTHFDQNLVNQLGPL
jgi:hypothetical protein